MAIRVGVNVQDSVIYRARSSCRDIMNDKRDRSKRFDFKSRRAGKEYPGLNRICRDLKNMNMRTKSIRSLCRKKWMTFCMKQTDASLRK